jgi:hypothetical protein
MGRPRTAFARRDLAAVLAVSALACGVSLPAARRANEKAAILACRDNLRKAGAAVLAYEQTHHHVPPASLDTPGTSLFRESRNGARCAIRTASPLIPSREPPAVRLSRRKAFTRIEPFAVIAIILNDLVKTPLRAKAKAPNTQVEAFQSK